MTRAVIKFTEDITPAMPTMEKAIESCVYNDVVPVTAFRYKNLGVIVHSHDMLITNASDEAAAIEVINFLTDIVNNTSEVTKKVKRY